MNKLARQMAAADDAANAIIASGGSNFYAEAGTKDSGDTPIWSGSFTGATGDPVLVSTPAGVFSVSKAVFAIYAAQRQALANSDRIYFNMTSGRDTANGATCDQSPSNQTIDQCIVAYMGIGNAAHLGKFDYDSLHQQWWADHIALVSMGALTLTQVASLYQTTFGLSAANISMSSSTLSGGVIARPSSLRNIAQQLMNGMNLKNYLLDAYPAVNASLYFTDGSVINSPAPSNQPWKYKDNHWIEPNNGGYWWAGSGGTVLWIDPTFTKYMLLFRVADTSGGEMGTQSIFALQRIRTAFYQGATKFYINSMPRHRLNRRWRR